MRLRHVQNNLFASDCQYFHNEKTFVRTTEVQQCVLITKIALFLHCIYLKLHCSQTIRIENIFHVYYYGMKNVKSPSHV